MRADGGGLSGDELTAPGLPAQEGLVIAMVVGADREEPDDDDPEGGAEPPLAGTELPFQTLGQIVHFDLHGGALRGGEGPDKRL